MASARNLMLPGNPRYQPKSLQEIFGYDKLFSAVAAVEVATMETLAEIGVIPPEDIAFLTSKVVGELLDIRTSEVDEVERTVTKHDIRAWVRIAQGIVGPRLARWVHVPLTSYDALDTARAVQFRRAYDEILKLKLGTVIGEFAALTRLTAGMVQIGRTHGQHALPITMGFWLAGILQRLVSGAQALDAAANGLVGKISGAVGAYNAQVGLGIATRCVDKSFETRVLEKLGLTPAPISSQILPPEPLADYLFACVKLSAAFGQLGRDCRHLMRSEIGEIAESFEQGQVGSSTMAHKRNPITFENLEGMWLRTKNEFGKVLDCLVSEHQRDLVGSSVARDYPIIVVNLSQQLETLLRKDKAGRSFIGRIVVDAAACRRNLRANADVIMAEPLYIALQMAGYDGDAHHLVNHEVVPAARDLGVPLVRIIETAVRDDVTLRRAWDAVPAEVKALLAAPERYTGDAQRKALEIADAAAAYLS
jgi:adenylosuccinate lyase